MFCSCLRRRQMLQPHTHQCRTPAYARLSSSTATQQCLQPCTLHPRMQRQSLSLGPRCRPVQRLPVARRRLRCTVRAQCPSDAAVTQQPGVAATRRQLLSATTALAGGLLLAAVQSLPAHAGMERYVKKKQLDPLETYVPLVLEARQRLAGLDGVAAESPSAARAALRTGAFSGLRDNIRAVGQYAAAPPAGSTAGALTEQQANTLVTAFFRALEDYDLLLYNAVREQQEQERKAAKAAKDGDTDADASNSGSSLDAGAAATKLAAAVARLDELIATVPADVLARSQAVLAKVSGSSS